MNKKTFSTNKRKAFSLIELSIVLIIIGLLIAAITGGSALIKGSSIHAVVSESRGYQAAINAFYDRYQGLPGDYSQAVTGTFTLPALGDPVDPDTTGSATGNGNGAIEFANARDYSVDRTIMEGNLAWQQLKNGGFVDKSFTPATNNATTNVAFEDDLIPGTNIPAAKVAGAGWIFDNIASQNVLILTGPITTNAVLTNNGAATLAAVDAIPVGVVTPNDASAIDIKADDGIANVGRVRAATNVATPGDCFVNAAYTLATAGKVCAVKFQVDIS